MDAAQMEKIDELIDALAPEQDVSMMSDEEKDMYEGMDEEDKMMYSKMDDDKKNEYRGMHDEEEKKAYMAKMREDEEEVEKQQADAEGTASADADERLEDLDEVQQENIDEVSKAIVKALAEPKTNGRDALLKLQKSLQEKAVDKNRKDETQKINKMINIMTMLAERVNTIEKAFSNLTEAIGIKEEVVKSVQASREKKVQKSQADDGASIGREIAKALREELGGTPGQKEQPLEVQKAIRDDSKTFVKGFADIFRNSGNVQAEKR